jgi:hypothetical protein
MPKPVNANLRRTLAGLLQAAAGGRPDLAWLDKAVRKAGYVPAAEALTRKDVRQTVGAISRTLIEAQEAARGPCCKESLGRAIAALAPLAAGK